MSNSIRAISAIAADIRTEWTQEKSGTVLYFGAVPYLDAMAELTNIRDMYGLDSGKNIVLYFLANANTFRGEQARALKAELREHLK